MALNVRQVFARPADRDYGRRNRGRFAETGLLGYRTGEGNALHRTRVGAYVAATVGAVAEFVKNPLGARCLTVAENAGAMVIATETSRPGTLADAAAQHVLHSGDPAATLPTLLVQAENPWQRKHVADVQAALAAAVAAQPKA